MSRRGRKKQRQVVAPANMTSQQNIDKEKRLRLQDGKAWAAAYGYGNHAGKTVTLNTALQLSTVWACIRLTAQAVSCLPLSMYERRGDQDRVRVASDEDVAEVICDSPNEDQTPLEFWESQVAWLMAMGNAYSEKVSTGSRLSALQPIPSTNCHPVRLENGELVYRVHDRGQSEDLPRDKVFHLKGFGFGGDLGLSPMSFGVQTFGAAIAMEEASAKVFGSGLQASGILSSENTLKPEQRTGLQSIMEKYTGSSNAGKLMILEAGLKYERLA